VVIKRYIRNNWFNTKEVKSYYGIDAELDTGEIVHVKNGDKAFWPSLRVRNATVKKWNTEINIANSDKPTEPLESDFITAMTRERY
jgi:hypothetical protein